VIADAPVGPSSEEEAAFLAQERENNAVIAAPPRATSVEAESQGGLPPMEDLVNRIPGPARQALEELFRGRFVTVRRLPQSALK